MDQKLCYEDESSEQELIVALAYAEYQFKLEMAAAEFDYKKELVAAKSELESAKSDYENQIKVAVEKARAEERKIAAKEIDMRVIEVKQKDELYDRERVRNEMIKANQIMLQANERFIQVMQANAAADTNTKIYKLMDD